MYKSIGKKILSGALAFVPMIGMAQDDTPPYVFDYYPLAGSADKFISFDPTGTGEYLPIMWGLDTAWHSKENIIRGMRHITPDIIEVVRVSYEPYALVTTLGVLPQSLKNNLDSRLSELDRIAKARTDGKKPAVALNLDATSPAKQGDYYYIKQQTNEETGRLEWVVDWEQGTKNHEEWAKLIDAYVKYIEGKGYDVISIAAFNEPDLEINGTHIAQFKEINEFIRKNHPDLNHIRLSGGNTLNPDFAYEWYDYLREDLDEGNTHQLAGTFDNYANFFKAVREDGKWATNDELHNTMECMVGAEYGMQEGIWWGQAERTRGQFCQASNKGTRLGYAENRGAWNSAAVYEWEGKVHAFVGASERQARVSSYSFVSTHPVYVDGAGPTNEFKVTVAGDPTGAYQTEFQRTAEGMYELSRGEDVQPELNGTFYIINKSSGKAVAFDASKTETPLVLAPYTPNSDGQKWKVGKVPYDNGGDFAYYYINAEINNGLSWNLYNFGLSENYEPTETRNTVPVWCWPNGTINDPERTRGAYDINMAWWLDYAGDGWFRIISKTSGYCVKNQQGKSADGTQLIQAPYNEGDDTQLFRFVRADAAPAMFETEAPLAPTNVAAVAVGGSVRVTWDAVADAEIAGYALLRADEGSDEFTTVVRNLAGTSIVDNTVLPGANYTYKVVAFDRSGNRSADSLTATASPEVKERSLVCSLSFEDNLFDGSGNSWHARTTNTPTYANGHSGRAMRVDANSGKLPQLPATAVPQSGEFTVTAWVYLPVQTSTVTAGYVFDFGSDDMHHVGLSMFNPNSQMSLSVANGGEERVITAPAPSIRTWHHVAAVLGNDEWKLYVDGEEVASLAESGLSENIPSGRMVMNYFGRSLCEYTYRESDAYTVMKTALSALDEARIYNFALTPEEVLADMAGEIAGVELLEASDAMEVGREYFNMKGQAVASPVAGEPVIVRIRRSDGSVDVRKIIATR